MIRRIHGKLESLGTGSAMVEVQGGFVYEVLLPGYALARLAGALGQPVTLHTAHYLEGSSSGGNMTPRLAGFLGETDRAFYDLFISVKGIGPRKALRAMSVPVSRIAAAIAQRDAGLLTSLPEIGRRTAETIIAALHGKVDRFLDGESSSPTGAAAVISGPGGDAVEIMVQLGEPRPQAIKYVDDALMRNPQAKDPQEILKLALRLRAGG